jgi:hypothetical protein
MARKKKDAPVAPPEGAPPPAPATPTGKPKQVDNGLAAPPVIQEIVDAAENYATLRDQRMTEGKGEVAAKATLLEVMKKHNLTVYKYDGKTVVIEPREENVKVKADKEEKAPDSED